MPSEIRVTDIKGSVGLGTINFNTHGQVLGGITTAEQLSLNNDLRLGLTPFLQMTQTISTDFSISSGYNALTVGPVTIGAGVTVTVPSGSNWTII